MVIQFGHCQAVAFAGIGEPHADAAGDRHDADIPPRRQRTGGECGGDIEHLVLIFGADHTGMAKYRVIGEFGAGHGAGVRKRAAPGRVRAPEFDDDARLAERSRLVRQAEKTPGTAHLLTQQHEDADLVLAQQMIGEIERAQMGLVAGAYDMAKANIPPRAPVIDGEAETTGLRNDGDSPPLLRAGNASFCEIGAWGEASIDAGAFVQDSDGVGTADKNAARCRDVTDTLLPLHRCAATFGKARAKDHRAFDAGIGAFFQRSRHALGGNGYHRQINRPADGGDRRIGGKTLNL